ncbi:MAG TPA: DeoR/GlpR family DNA-binding transcription regulator [Lacunisphaera sp.]|nr:DeoR/GlpR family DNA-binding transcription regulator [Lacunisphaera sp.]
MSPKPRTSRKEAPNRREEIIQWVRKEGSLSYEQIQKRFAVAPMTARRDVAALAGQGKVVRSLRGATWVPPDGFLAEGPLWERLGKNLPAKRSIAKAAARLIKANSTLYLDGSTTSIELARIIARQRLEVTIVTNSVLVSACFCNASSSRVVQLGGTLNLLSGCTTGTDTEAAAAQFFIDVGFFATLGYIPGEGTYESFADTFRVKQAVAKRCAQVVLILDHTKFGKRSLNRVLEDATISTIITDRPVPHLKDPRLILAS